MSSYLDQNELDNIEMKAEAYTKWLLSDSYQIFLHDLKGVVNVPSEVLEYLPQFAFDAGWQAKRHNIIISDT